MHQVTCAGRRALATCLLAAATMGAAAAQEVTPPDRPISLQEAIQIALQNQGDVQATEESVVVARMGVIQAAAPLKPNVRAGATFDGSASTGLAGILGATPGNSFSFDKGIKPFVRATQTIFDGGITRLSVRQARTSVESAQARLQAVRNDLAFSVSDLYLRQLRAQAILALRIEQVRQGEQQLQDVLERIKVGTLAAVERFLQEAQLEQNRVEQVAAENALKVAAINLRNLLGLEPTGPPLRLIEPVQHPEELELPSLLELQDRAMKQRPEVLQAEASLRIQQASVSIARLNRTLLPNGQISATFVPADDLQKANGSVALQVQMPLWDAGVTRSREYSARANARAASATLEQTKKDVATDVQAAFLNYVSALQRVQASIAAVRAADANVQATAERFRLGAAGVTVVNLVAAQVAFFDNNASLIQAKYDVTLAQAQLERAVGKAD